MRTFVDTIPLAEEKLLAAELIGQFWQPDNEDKNHTLSDKVLLIQLRQPHESFLGFWQLDHS